MAARRSTGGVVTKQTKHGTSYAIRFRACGRRQYVTLGLSKSKDGWDRKGAEDALANTLADVRRGLWRPPADVVPEPEPLPEPTFHEFASDWLARRAPELRPRTVQDYSWSLELHLLPFFAAHRLSAITIEEVDRYRALKVAQGVLGATAINKTLTRLAQILGDAVEYGRLPSNPASGRRRRLKAPKPRRAYLDTAEQIDALLNGASELDERGRGRPYRRTLLCVLIFAGLRIGEALALRWRDVDLATGRLTVASSKTDAGERTVDLLPVLANQLAMHGEWARRTGASDLVFATGKGTPLSDTNCRRRVLVPAIAAADRELAARGLPPIPEGLTPHGLRRTFASVLIATGADPVYVKGQLGHTDPSFTLRVYAHEMARRDGERDRLRALVDGSDWAPAGSNAPESTSDAEFTPAS
jgi:integrase